MGSCLMEVMFKFNSQASEEVMFNVNGEVSEVNDKSQWLVE